LTTRAKTLGALAGISGIWFDEVDLDEEEVNDKVVYKSFIG
jgi:hypothetical protein